MTHSKVAYVHDWRSSVLATYEESADLAHRSAKMQKAIGGHESVMFPLLADLHILCDIKRSKLINSFFTDEKKTKGEAEAELATWKAVQTFIEGLIPQNQREDFHNVRRSRVLKPNT